MTTRKDRLYKKFMGVGFLLNQFSSGCVFDPQVDNLEELFSQELTTLFARIEEEVKSIGDTSDYPEWNGVSGQNTGLIPKERVIELLHTLKQEYGVEKGTNE